jgi:hypothetical protein
MKVLRFFIIVLLTNALLTSCNKEPGAVINPEPPNKIAATPGVPHNLYFISKNGNVVKSPTRFGTLEKAISFFRANYVEVPADYIKKRATSPIMRANLDDDPPAPEETTTGNSGFLAGDIDLPADNYIASVYDLGFYDENDLCPENMSNLNVTLPGYIRAMRFGYELEAEYGQRGIICVIHFQIVVAPAPLGATKKYFYKAYPGEYMTITGGALGTITPMGTIYDLNKWGEGHIEANASEQRVYILKSNNKSTFKVGSASQYPVGMTLEDGSTVQYSANSVTSYHVKYNIEFFDSHVLHHHNQVTEARPCNWSTAPPILGYTDAGTTFVGVPSN